MSWVWQGKPEAGWLKLQTAWGGSGLPVGHRVEIHMTPQVMELAVECANDLCETMTRFSSEVAGGALGDSRQQTVASLCRSHAILPRTC